MLGAEDVTKQRPARGREGGVWQHYGLPTSKYHTKTGCLIWEGERTKAYQEK